MISKKKILITGKGSYIGTTVKNWLLDSDEQQYMVDEVCVKDKNWRDMDFSRYDVVFHVAGIAHSETNNATEEIRALYYKVNTELAIEVAKKAKLEGVCQFIFMSSMIVYGESVPFGSTKKITKDTPPKPVNFYGDSKWQAELGLAALKSIDFKIAIIRPPMIYGKDSKGNYPRLAKLARKLPLFLDVNNTRSMLHVDNLCEFVRLVIRNVDDGVFHPQNAEYVKTTDLVVEIAAVNGKRIYLVKFLNPLFSVLSKRVALINKVFGNLNYDMALSEYKDDYRVRNFKESIQLTEEV